MLDANSNRRGLSTIFPLSLGPAPEAPSAFVPPSWLRVASSGSAIPKSVSIATLLRWTGQDLDARLRIVLCSSRKTE
jgi:hypothetical protein